MKVVNIVLGGVILVLALVCTVFSYFLFEKRTALVGGWNEMASGINAASAELAKESGSGANRVITKEELAHDKCQGPNDVKSKMSSFQSQSKKVREQRDEFAGELVAIGGTIKMKEAPDKQVLIAECGSTEKDSKGAKAVSAGVKKVVSQRDSAIREADKKRKEMNDIARAAGTRPEAKAIVGYINDKKEELEEKENKLKDKEKELRKAKSDLSTAKDQRDDYQGKLENAQEKNRQLEAQLEKVKRDYQNLTGEPHGKTREWKPGSKEARRKIVGHVLAVSREYGYVVIDLNKGSRVSQKIGKHEHQVDPQLSEGDELQVCRGDINGKDKPEIIARVKINSVDDKCSVADLPAEAAKVVEVGDCVIFPREDDPNKTN